MYCGKCGKELKPEWDVCPYCGEKINKTTEKQGYRMALGTGVFLLLVVGFALWKNGADPARQSVKEKNVQETTAEEQEDQSQAEDSSMQDTDEGDDLQDTDVAAVADDQTSEFQDAQDEAWEEDSWDEEEDYYGESDSISPLDQLRSVAYEEYCDYDVLESSEGLGGQILTKMGEDGSYFDEVILGAWFDEDGEPRADFPPDNLKNALFGRVDYTQLKYFSFINGEDITLEQVKRRGTADYWYALVLENIQKQKDEYGNIYFEGTEPISGENVVVKGNFDKLLNGDSVLAFGSSMGTAVDDTLNIRGAYLEFINKRVQDLF